ncbi:Pentatricopeptide repeat-containing protein, chloroplastic, partial [Mucuna pruriens]
MASLSTTTPGVPPFPPPTPTHRTASTRAQASPRPEPVPSSPALAVTDERTMRIAKELEKMKAREAKERKEMTNRKIASQKAVSVILRREATKAIIDQSGRKKKGPINSKKLLPITVLEALHERITALRWESALKVSACFVSLIHCGLLLAFSMMEVTVEGFGDGKQGMET